MLILVMASERTDFGLIVAPLLPFILFLLRYFTGCSSSTVTTDTGSLTVWSIYDGITCKACSIAKFLSSVVLVKPFKLIEPIVSESLEFAFSNSSIVLSSDI